jgi:hypothetical protein
MAGMPGGSSSSKLASFRPNTRQRLRTVGSVPAAIGTQQSLTFPQVGLLSHIFLSAQLTATFSSATPTATASTFGPWNALKRITGITNLGTATIFDLSGYGAYLLSKTIDTCFELAQVNSDVTADPFYLYPLTFTQNVPAAFSFNLLIPVAANDGDQFQIGLINLQAPEIRFTLQLTFTSTPVAASSLADIYNSSSTFSALGGNVYVYYEYYEVPNPANVQLPPRILHRAIEDRYAITSVGDTTYTVPRQGIMLQCIHNVILNGQISKNATDVTGRRLVFNKTDTPYSYDYIVDRILARRRYGSAASLKSGTQGGLDLPGGAYIWDFFFANAAPSRGDLRDTVDTEALATLESIITISTGATLGSSNNFLDTVRRITQQY